jgi:DAK2 domain fusion protein YloV
MAHYPRSISKSGLWNGDDLLNAFEFATRWLDHNRDVVNALNVFPIPDGDTGTNMALTMHASVDAARKADQPTSAGSVAGKLAYGALMGARGNSGVILSQIFRGFAAAIADRDTIDGEDLARALEGARQMAYKAVMRPVEGTMLTIIRVGADQAATSAARTSALMTVLKDALAGAEEALAQTPDMLDILRQAGVVDAGGQGVVHILEGLYRYAQGDTIIDEANAAVPIGAEMRFLDDIAETHGEDAFGYCTNFMVFGEGMDFDRVRADLAEMGQSAVIVGDDTVVKVHIHTENPGTVLQYALGLGYLDQVKIDNMTLQTEALTDQRQKATHDVSPTPDTAPEASAVPIDGDTGVIAVAAGAGLAGALRSMGANYIVPGGQTMNPSTEELLEAVRKMPVDQIIILPNNKNIIMAANQVTALTEKTIHVIPSRSVPQGLAALASFNRDASLGDNVRKMTSALDDVQSIEITEAVRDVELNGITVVTGNLIGMVNDELVASGLDLGDIVTRTLMTLEDIDPELLTVFVGEDATDAATDALRDTAATIFPEAEIEIIEGNQPHYQYLIAVE